MPWDDNNSGGPWGQSPGGGDRGPRRPNGGGGGRNGPNLEDLLSRGRDQFNGQMPGGRWWIIGGAVALVGLWIFNSVYTVAEQQLGVEMVFGKPKEELSTAGLNWHWWPVETVELVSVTENQTNVGVTSINRRSSTDDGLMLSGDQNIVDVAFSVLWRVNSPTDYLFNVENPDEMVRKASESAMREVVGRRPAREIFRDERDAIRVEVSQITQQILDTYGAGIGIEDVTIPQAAPPEEVADAFDEVQRAEQDEDRFQEEARRYANTLLGEARGQAAQIVEEAEAYKDRVVKEAEGEASRFLSIYEEYAKAPEVTRKRLFLETMEQVLGTSNMVILESGDGGQGVVPYLPLNELRSNSSQ